jgi:glycosyltransferase involved in cell wall biosynthesis
MVATTVVICTHNRAGVVERAIDASLDQARAAGGEVLIVDNASTDGTPALLETLARRHHPVLRVVHEPRLGLSAARNRGLVDARGEVAAFLDDDAVPRPGWLRALAAPYDAPAVGCVGGPVRLRLPDPPPAWLSPALHPALSAFDAGTAPKRLRYGHEDYPYGANISFRVREARARGGFSTRLGPLGRSALVHDETDLCYRLDAAGAEIHYAPEAVVDHWVMPERLSPEWFLRRSRLGGESAAIFVLRNRGLLRALWRIRWLYARHLLAVPHVPREPVDAARLVVECRRREALGYVLGLARALPSLHVLRREAVAPIGLPATSP